MPTNYYEILGVDRDATYAAIRRAYRKLVLELHPDHNDAPDAEERLKRIIEAYDVLKDESSRSDHDHWIEWQEQEERRQRRAQADRAQREEAERRREERLRQQAEAERRQREEAEQRQQQAEERRQREERVRLIEEERRRRQAEERLREEAEPGRQETHEQDEEPISEAAEPTTPARKKRLASATVAASLVVLIAGIFVIVYLFRTNDPASEIADQPTPDLVATIMAAVATAWPTAVPTIPPTTAVPPASATQRIVDPEVTISERTPATTPASAPTQHIPATPMADVTPTAAPAPAPIPTITPAPVGNDYTDRAALESFYAATGGDDWTNNANWLSSRRLGEWHGVSVNTQGQVTQIALDGNNLTGSLPTQLGNLTGLERLSLHDNTGLSGSLPAGIGDMPDLTRLAVSNTGLSGELPQGLINSTMQYLHFDGTELCAPTNKRFQDWLDGVMDKKGPTCGL